MQNVTVQLLVLYQKKHYKKFPVTFKLNIPNKPSSSITSLIFQEYLSDSYAQNSPFIF